MISKLGIRSQARTLTRRKQDHLLSSHFGQSDMESTIDSVKHVIQNVKFLSIEFRNRSMKNVRFCSLISVHIDSQLKMLRSEENA